MIFVKGKIKKISKSFNVRYPIGLFTEEMNQVNRLVMQNFMR